ncbi:hypothetical protein GBF38_004334 [Nibea albiflora]|uniref:Uncharacterized protein n=1 Tax=Nibea albiflora TaxID=240163 RepID=A0ACB7FD49_NIBAL|nr:hypothetical protein GBF38_004334 [Nibea albiflora]
MDTMAEAKRPKRMMTEEAKRRKGIKMSVVLDIASNAVVKQQLHTPVAPRSVFVAVIQPRGCVDDTAGISAQTQQSYPPCRLHSAGCVTSLSVVAGQKEGASCSDQVYSKYDSWTSGYRPHVTQVVNL